MPKHLAAITLLLLCSHYTIAQYSETQIKAARTASNEAIARHDANGIVRDMLPDYSIVTGRGQHVQGKDSMLTFWKQTFKAMPGVIYLRTPSTIIVSKNDSLAWETGQWTASSLNPSFPQLPHAPNRQNITPQ